MKNAHTHSVNAHSFSVNTEFLMHFTLRKTINNQKNNNQSSVKITNQDLIANQA